MFNNFLLNFKFCPAVAKSYGFNLSIIIRILYEEISGSDSNLSQSNKWIHSLGSITLY